jgi:hypothetical protein
MLGDKLFNFKRDVAGEGFFDQLKKEFKSLNEFIEANSADFEAVGRAISKTLTVVVKAFAAAVRAVARAVGFVRRQVENLLRLLGKDIPLVVEIDKVGKSVDDTNVKLGKQQTLFEKIRDGIKKQNDAFDLSKEIVGTITKSVGSVSKSLAEAVVLGKDLNASLKQLAQSILVEIVAKTIERIALLGIEKLLTKTILKNEDDKTASLRMQSREMEKQLGLQAAMAAFNFASGGFKLPFFASGGAVRKGQPTIVGERGAEMFIPNSSGQITQSARGTNGSPVNVNFNINTVDASGFEELLIRSRGTISQLINQSLNEKGQGNLI